MTPPCPPRNRVLLTGLALAAALVVTAGAQQSAPSPPSAATPTGSPAIDTKPWPDAATLATRKQTAENLPLFASNEPLVFTLMADFGAVQRDREESSNNTYPATVLVARQDGSEASIPVRIRTRGHSRRKPINCTFAPLRIEFPSNPVGTVFEGQKNLKLGTHCRDYGEYPQYVVREYPIYRMYNLLTPRSFRVRLAEAHYVDAKNKTPVRGRWSLFLEDEDDVGRRLEGRTTDVRGLSFRRSDRTTTTQAFLFEYMIGNTDLSMRSQHNIRIVETPGGTNYIVPYDFDYAGVVDAPYAAAFPELRLGSVRERLYRGPCHDGEELEKYFARFRALHGELLGVYDAIPQLPPNYVRKAKNYLEGFFRTIENPDRVKREFINGCDGRPYV